MSTKHTPGPWILTENGSNNYITVESAGHTVIHQDDLGSIPDEAYRKDAIGFEMLANAQLIAAAPDLLEALKSFRHVDGCFCEASFAGPGCHPSHWSECKAAQAAISKAEGIIGWQT